jgi:hypothetical protein
VQVVLNPNNYRGITVMSCLAKLFNRVLNNRLDSFLECNSIIVKEQIGFQKKSRTSDHMFILRIMIDKYKNMSKVSKCYRKRRPTPIFCNFKKVQGV